MLSTIRRLMHGPPVPATFAKGSRLRVWLGGVDTVATVKGFYFRWLHVRADVPVPVPNPLPDFPGFCIPRRDFYLECGQEIVSVLDRWGMCAGLSFSRGSTPHIVAARLKAIDLAGFPVIDTNSRIGRRAFCEAAGTMLDRLGLQDIGIYNRPRGHIEFTIPGRNDWQHDPKQPAAWGTDAATVSNQMCQQKLAELLVRAFPLLGIRSEDEPRQWGIDVAVAEISWLARARRQGGSRRAQEEAQAVSR